MAVRVKDLTRLVGRLEGARFGVSVQGVLSHQMDDVGLASIGVTLRLDNGAEIRLNLPEILEVNRQSDYAEVRTSVSVVTFRGIRSENDDEEAESPRRSRRSTTQDSQES